MHSKEHNGCDCLSMTDTVNFCEWKMPFLLRFFEVTNLHFPSKVCLWFVVSIFVGQSRHEFAGTENGMESSYEINQMKLLTELYVH